MNATTPLMALQERFAILDLDGEIRVIKRDQLDAILSGESRDDLAMYKKQDAHLLMRRALEALPMPFKPSHEIDNFWISPKTRLYTAIAFTPEATPDTTINFWVGPRMDAKPGNWVELRDFLRDVVCAGDGPSYDYLIQYLAHMVQRPQEKPGIMITLLGGQGTGKGTFCRLVEAIWPRTTLLVNNVDQVTGRFNACLERSYNVFIDEGIFAGDRRATDALKSMITEPTVRIERKYQPSRSIGSVHRFFGMSNHAHFATVDMDDRRFVFLRTSDARKQDTAYFASVIEAIEDADTVGALLYYLQRKDLTRFNVHSKLDTVENMSQKLKSLHGFERFWYEVLSTGYLNGQGPSDWHQGAGLLWTDSVFLPSHDLLTWYKDATPGAQRFQMVQLAEVLVNLNRLCPSAKKNRHKTSGPGNPAGIQKRGVDLPDLATARLEFEAAIGGVIPCTW